MPMEGAPAAGQQRSEIVEIMEADVLQISRGRLDIPGHAEVEHDERGQAPSGHNSEEVLPVCATEL
jgi:hypothetical protein